MNLHPETHYIVECWRRGQLVWRDAFHNLVTTVGRNKVLDATFKTGIAAPAWYFGLVNNSGFSAYAAADTMASHAGWTEVTAYNEATRQAFTPGTPSGGSTDNSANRAICTMNGANGTVRGCFLTDSSTKGGATGTLYGAGDFTVTRPYIAGDQIYVQTTITV